MYIRLFAKDEEGVVVLVVVESGLKENNTTMRIKLRYMS